MRKLTATSFFTSFKDKWAIKPDFIAQDPREIEVKRVGEDINDPGSGVTISIFREANGKRILGHSELLLLTNDELSLLIQELLEIQEHPSDE